MLIQASYFVAAGLFIFGLEADELAGDCARRHRLGRRRHARRDADHLPLARDAQLRADDGRDRDRRHRRVDLGQTRRDDRHAADDRALQRHGRRRGRRDRGSRAVRGRRARRHAAFSRRARRHHRRGVVCGQPDCVRQAPGPHQAQLPLPRPELRELRSTRRHRARRRDHRAARRREHGRGTSRCCSCWRSCSASR